MAPLDISEIEHVFAVRAMLESRAVALAAGKHKQKDVAPIATAFDGAERAIAAGDLRALLLMDHGFHRAVAAATHNPPLARVLISLLNHATRFWIWQMARQLPDEQARDVVLHRAMAQAILTRDAAAAETLCLQLIGEPPSAGRG